MRIPTFSFIFVVRKEGNRPNEQDYSHTGLIKQVNRSAIILRPLRLKEKSPEQKSMSLSLFHEIIRKP